MDKKGFTLIELLVSIAIFAVLISVVAYSFRFTLNIAKYVNYQYAQDLQIISKLRDSLDSIFYFVGQNDRAVEVEDKFFTYFYGDKKEIKYITAEPVLFKKDVLVLGKIYETKNNIYLEEYPVYDKEINYKIPKFKDTKPKKIVLFENVDKFEIEYYKGKERKSQLKEEIPTLIKMSFVQNRKEKKEFNFKIKSDFKEKEKINEESFEGI
jgi:prepilin-type N-terminal cleavage/methylation domain-containing protein